MYTRIQRGSITLALDKSEFLPALSSRDPHRGLSVSEATSQDESSVDRGARASEMEMLPGGDDSYDEYAGEGDRVRVANPIFSNPLRFIDLDADINEFLAAKRISDVGLLTSDMLSLRFYCSRSRSSRSPFLTCPRRRGRPTSAPTTSPRRPRRTSSSRGTERTPRSLARG